MFAAVGCKPSLRGVFYSGLTPRSSYLLSTPQVSNYLSTSIHLISNISILPPVSKKGWKKAFYRSMLTMMLVIYAFTFLFLTAECYRVQSAFVDHGQTDESIFIRLTWNGVRWNRICRQISWAAVMFLSDCVMAGAHPHSFV